MKGLDIGNGGIEVIPVGKVQDALKEVFRN